MARARISPAQKKARHERAKREATRLNTKLPPQCSAEASEWGKVYVYARPPGRPKVRIHSPFPSPEFLAELAAALRGEPLEAPTSVQRRPTAPARAVVHSWRWACEDYFENDPTFRAMSKRDKRVRRNVLESTWAEPIHPGSPLKFGDMPLSEFNGNSVLVLMKRKVRWATFTDPITHESRERETNLSAANMRHKLVSAIFSYLLNNHKGHLIGGRNWARDIKPFKPENEDGHRTPSLDEIRLFQGVFALGTKERLLFDLAYYTTQRRADLPRLGRQFLRKDRYGNDRLEYVQHKLRNKKPVTAFVPIFPELQSSLDAAQASGILGEMLFLVQQKHPGQPDKPYVEGSLGNMMQDAIRHLRANHGLREPFSLHGLRKAGVCRLILMDLSVHQIMAITGHRTAKEIDRYGRDYMRSLASEEGYQRYVAWRGRNKRSLDAEGGLFCEPALP